MSSTTKTFRRLSAGLQRRFRNARRGSVLILVVALLVLMALIGTAWLSSARLDRFDVRQSTFSAQIDLLVDGVINMDKAAHINDISSGGIARPKGYGAYDVSQADGFIASRTPVVLRDICPIWSAFEVSQPVDAAYIPGLLTVDPPRKRKYYEGQFVRVQIAANEFEYYVCTLTHIVDANDAAVPARLGPPANTHPYWRFVGVDTPAVLNNAADPLAMTRQIYGYTPIWPAITRLFPGDNATKFQDISTGNQLAFGNRTYVIPTWMDFAGDPKFPAFLLYSSDANPTATVAGARGGMITVPAADTDGDGVADAGLFRLPVGTLEGLDYFAAVRVVDNSAAINFNTAMSQRADIDFVTAPAFTTNATLNGLTGTFKSHVGLFEWLNPSRAADDARWLELTQFNFQRWGGATPAPTTAHPPGTAGFTTWGEAIETDAGRRLNYPIGQYQPFSNGLAGTFAYRGGLLRNPDAIPSLLERNLAAVKIPVTATEVLDSQFYDPLGERLPNNWLNTSQPDTQNWKTYKEAPLRAGPRRDGSGTVKHPYDPVFADSRYTVWPSFIHRWFDENFNHWGYTDNRADPNVITPPDNVPVAATLMPARLVMGGDSNEMYPARSDPAKAVRRSIRPVLVARNPLGNWGSVPTLAPVTGIPLPPTMDAPSSANQPKASVNTAGFSELYRAFWSVMAEEWMPTNGVHASHTPFSQRYRYLRGYADPTVYGDTDMKELRTTPLIGDPLYGSWHNNPFIGMHFTSDEVDVAGDETMASQKPDTASYLPAAHPLHMFRSVLRPNFATVAAPYNPSTPRMQPDQVLLLRAAIAAVNAIDLRDDNEALTVQDVEIPLPNDTSRDVAAFPGDDTPALVARVFGTEHQPYITEVYTNTFTDLRVDPDRFPTINALDNPNGYIAIELHNPYDVPIDIRGCRIATINRQDANSGSGGVARNTGAGPAVPAVVNYTHDYLPSKLQIIDRSTLAAEDQRITLDPTATWGGNSAAEVFIHSNMEQVTPGTNFHAPTVIPAHGYLVLENFDARTIPSSPVPPPTDARPAKYRPPSAQIPGPTGLPGEHGPTDKDDVAMPEQKSERWNFAYVKNLDRLMNQEFVLLRPFNAEVINVPVAGTATAVQSFVIRDATDDTAPEMAPLDSFDFTGMVHPTDVNSSGRAYAWHYVRAHNPATKGWRFVYPGRYDGLKSVPTAAAPGEQRPRHQGTDEARELIDPLAPIPKPGPILGWDPGAIDPWEPSGSAGMAIPRGAPPMPGFSFGYRQDILANSDASYPIEFTIQIQNTDMPGPRGITTGVFARNGDILQVPFIGAYTIKLPTQTTVPMAAQVLEMNSLPMDAAFAEDTDRSNDPPINTVGETAGVRREQIGRFVPLPAVDLAVAGRGTLDPVDTTSVPPRVEYHTVGDLERSEAAVDYWSGAGPTGSTYDMVITAGPFKGRKRMVAAFDPTPTKRHLFVSTPWQLGGAGPTPGTTYELRRGTYRWTTDLFDYLTVHAPHEDAVPNETTGTPVGGEGPVDGLININTAPWRVLAAIPWTTVDTDAITYNDATQIQPGSVFTPGMLVAGGSAPPIPDNYDIARAIVAYRDSEIAAGADPLHIFESIYDLYRVPGFQYFSDQTHLVAAGGEPNDVNGDLTPQGAAATSVDGVRYDFEEQYLFLNRVSNLISTRSDSFTNYILVQGWRGIGTANPELVVQRQRAFVTDRSGVTSNVKSISTEFFYNE